MAYVVPNSKLQLFKGINLDNRYMHTVHFASESAQNSTFSGKVFKSYNNLMFHRVNDTQIKIEEDSTVLQGVTYMRFQNSRTGNKWYYAFVLSCDYVNENTSIITYEIDVMQTWFEQGGSVRPSFVLRQHVNNDTFGLNLENEPVGSDVYDCEEIHYTSPDGTLFNNYSIITNTTESLEEGDSPINNNLFNGTKFREVPMSNPTQVAIFWLELQSILEGSWSSGEKPVEVIDMFTFPSAYSHTDETSNRHPITIRHNSNFQGYKPKNNKLFGYPFSYLHASTKNGSGCSYKWEYFDGLLQSHDTVTFITYGNPIGGGSVVCYPAAYNGVTNNLDAKISINDFPKNPYNYDAYEAWLAAGGSVKLENEERITNVRGVTALVKSASNAILGNAPSGIAQSGVSSVNLANNSGTPATNFASLTGGGNRIIQGVGNYVDTVMNVVEAKNKIAYQWADAVYQPNQLVGMSTPNVTVATKMLDFYFYNVHVRNDELKRIDDFLSAYGYAINKIENVNLTGRKYWNFVQTQGAVIAGDMPSSSKEAIGRILDGGITFWHNIDQIGNYNQSVTSGTINNPIV